MGRAPCCEKDSVKRGPWTPEEDAKLLACVAQHGTGSWRTVPKKAGLQRCGKSCRLRWTNYLRPDLKHGRFTDQEEQTIVKLHAALGSRWSLIAAQLPGRTDNDVKNYWNTRLKKKLCEMGIDPITHKPISQLLADLAGSMAHAAAASSSTSPSPSPPAGGRVGPPGMMHIADAALGCFKDDMLNVIMRRRPPPLAESACPPHSVPRVPPPPPPYLRHQLAGLAGPDGLPHCLRFLTPSSSSPSPAATASTCSSSTLTGGHSPALMYLPHEQQQQPQHTARSMVDMALLQSSSSLTPGLLPPFTQGCNHQKPNDSSFNQLKSLPLSVNTCDYSTSALSVAHESALSMNNMAVTNQEMVEQPWLITEEEQDFQQQSIMWPVGTPQDHHHQATSSTVNVRINSTCATNITSKVEMPPWSPSCTSRSSSTCSNLPGLDHHHATTAASTNQLADHTTQLSPADAMLWDLSDLLP